MAEITAAAVKALRDRTQLPMMECKKALTDAGGDEEAAIELLRKQGEKFFGTRDQRATEEGRLALYASIDPPVGAMIELQCESAPVATNDDFMQLATDLATQLATGPGAATPDELWTQPSPSHKGMTLMAQKDELANKIREVFRLPRILRIDGPTTGYLHHTGKDAVLLEHQGGTAEVAKDICMHITALKPEALTPDDVDPDVVAKERAIQLERVKAEGKPDNIAAKIVEGRMRAFYAQVALTEQPFVKDEKRTVGQVAKEAGMKLLRAVHWQLGGMEQGH